MSEGDVLYPLEIKKHADPKASDIANFDVLDRIPGIRRGPGGVICMYDQVVTLKGQGNPGDVSIGQAAAQSAGRMRFCRRVGGMRPLS